MGFPIYYNLQMLLFLSPALILAFIAQMWVQSAYARGRQMAASVSGFMAARRLLDSAGLQQVEIETVPGQLSDHYDPRGKVLRLSEENY
ncbi:MAG TPA: zinc metallopeptidase, partial [Pirellulaceae bacterium]|nr:zinc metallopeptidase [Pirellulaceae bacterium]